MSPPDLPSVHGLQFHTSRFSFTFELMRRCVFLLLLGLMVFAGFAFFPFTKPKLKVGMFTELSLPFALKPKQNTGEEVDLLASICPDSCQLILNQCAVSDSMHLLVSIPFETSHERLEEAIKFQNLGVRKRVDVWGNQLFPSFFYKINHKSLFRTFFSEPQSNIPFCLDLLVDSSKNHLIEPLFEEKEHPILKNIS